MDLEKLLQSHRARTLRRMSRESTALIVQDSTDLNYSTRSHCQDLGQIGTNQTGAKSRGLRLHSSLALSAEGLPLGIVHSCKAALRSRPRAKTRSGPLSRRTLIAGWRALRRP
jgi:hypothetical protein